MKRQKNEKKEIKIFTHLNEINLRANQDKHKKVGTSNVTAETHLTVDLLFLVSILGREGAKTFFFWWREKRRK